MRPHREIFVLFVSANRDELCHPDSVAAHICLYGIILMTKAARIIEIGWRYCIASIALRSGIADQVHMRVFRSTKQRGRRLLPLGVNCKRTSWALSTTKGHQVNCILERDAGLCFYGTQR